MSGLCDKKGTIQTEDNSIVYSILGGIHLFIDGMLILLIN